MSVWKRWDEVEIRNIFKKIPSVCREYLIQLWVKDAQHPLGTNHSIHIIASDFTDQIQELCEGKRDRCYFSFGNQDIDFFKTKDGKFAIMHSPYEGLNMVFVLSDGELKKLLDDLSRDNEFPLVTQLQATKDQTLGP